MAELRRAPVRARRRTRPAPSAATPPAPPCPRTPRPTSSSRHGRVRPGGAVGRETSSATLALRAPPREFRPPCARSPHPGPRGREQPGLQWMSLLLATMACTAEPRRPAKPGADPVVRDLVKPAFGSAATPPRVRLLLHALTAYRVKCCTRAGALGDGHAAHAAVIKLGIGADVCTANSPAPTLMAAEAGASERCGREKGILDVLTDRAHM